MDVMGLWVVGRAGHYFGGFVRRCDDGRFPQRRGPERVVIIEHPVSGAHQYLRRQQVVLLQHVGE